MFYGWEFDVITYPCSIFNESILVEQGLRMTTCLWIQIHSPLPIDLYLFYRNIQRSVSNMLRFMFKLFDILFKIVSSIYSLPHRIVHLNTFKLSSPRTTEIPHRWKWYCYHDKVNPIKWFDISAFISYMRSDLIVDILYALSSKIIIIV